LGQDAFEGYRDHGVFTYALLDALRNGDTNRNGKIELSELVAHVQNLVPKLAAVIGAAGGSIAGVKGITTIKRGPGRFADQQTARYGSRGEDFALVNRLEQESLGPPLPRNASARQPTGSRKKSVTPDWRTGILHQ
jgi:hypothetical protein